MTVWATVAIQVLIEVEYFIELCGTVPELASFPKAKFGALRDIYRNFSIEDVRPYSCNPY